MGRWKSLWADLSSSKYQGARTDHFDGERFHNEIPSKQSMIDFTRWLSSKTPDDWRPYQECAPQPIPPARVAVGRARVTFINHSTVLLQFDGMNVLTDPIWSERASPIGFLGPRRHRSAGIRLDDLPPIDAILLSHNHYDHFDVDTLHWIDQRDQPQFITGLGNAGLLASHQLGDEQRRHEIDWWQHIEVECKQGRLRVDGVPAQHFSQRTLQDRNRTLWLGFVVDTQGGPIYFAGDTGMGPHFTSIRERLGRPRLALLPIGGSQPRWLMQAIHLSPEEAVAAHVDLGAAISLAIHFGTFPFGEEGQDEPLLALHRAVAHSQWALPQFWVLEHGEGRDVPKRVARADDLRDLAAQTRADAAAIEVSDKNRPSSNRLLIAEE